MRIIISDSVDISVEDILDSSMEERERAKLIEGLIKDKPESIFYLDSSIKYIEKNVGCFDQVQKDKLLSIASTM
jgi:hypothetical protein